MNNEIISIFSEGATKRLVFLHGWGADAGDLLPLGKALNATANENFELLFLQAPYQHPQGLGRQWFSLYPHDWESMPKEIEVLKKRLNLLETKEIGLQKTVLVGFSQGAAMALISGCHLPVAGIISCSGFTYPGWIPPLNRPPVLLTHGKNDNVVPPQSAENIFEVLNKNNVELEFFNGGHEIPQCLLPKFLLAINNWM